MGTKPPIMFDDLCALVRRYIEEQPYDGGRYDSWPDRVDGVLSDIRSEISRPASPGAAMCEVSAPGDADRHG